MGVALFGHPPLHLVDGLREGLTGGVEQVGAPSRILGGPPCPAVGVLGMSTVPGGPAQEGIDSVGIPSAGVTYGEPVAPDFVGDVDQTHRDPVQ